MTESNQSQKEPQEESAQPVSTDPQQIDLAPAVSPSDVNKNSAAAMGVSQVPDESGDAERQRELEQQSNNQQSGEGQDASGTP